jgi:hypothetical protein
MHYLANHYKNLCEQLQEKVNYLEKILKEQEDPNSNENMKRQAFGNVFSKTSQKDRDLHDFFKQRALDLVRNHPHLGSVDESIAHVSSALDKKFPIQNSGELIPILMETGHLHNMMEKLGDRLFGRHVADMLISAERDAFGDEPEDEDQFQE